MFCNLKKLDVGDIAAYERRIKEQRKSELIDTFKQLHGDNMPPDAVLQIDRELKKIPSIFSAEGSEIDADAVQFLLWRSVIKTSPDTTIEEVGANMNTETMMEYINKILPIPDEIPKAKKKAVKKARKKKQKDN
jgi:hypothetical protein